MISVLSIVSLCVGLFILHWAAAKKRYKAYLAHMEWMKNKEEELYKKRQTLQDLQKDVFVLNASFKGEEQKLQQLHKQMESLLLLMAQSKMQENKEAFERQENIMNTYVDQLKAVHRNLTDLIVAYDNSHNRTADFQKTDTDFLTDLMTRLSKED